MGSTTSLISEKNSRQISSVFLSDCRKALEKFGQSHKEHNVSSSIKYLEKKDVVDQFARILTNFPIGNKAELRISNTIGVTYAEILLTDKNGKLWIANFWPCDACACVALRKL
jgi:hypothetical protein